MTSALYRETGLSVSARSVGETFTCRICRQVKPKNAPNQRHCSAACRKKADRRRATARHRRLNRGAHHGAKDAGSPNSGIRARQRRRRG